MQTNKTVILLTQPDLTRPRFYPAALALLAALSLGAGPALAQAARTTTLNAAVTAALPTDPTVKTAQANLTQAQAASTAAQNDPATLVAARLSAANALGQARASLKAAQLATLQATIGQYVALLEAQQSADLSAAQVQVQQKAVQVAQVKLGTGNATPLDVQNAKNTLAGGQQNLAAAQAQLNLASNRLATQMGTTGPLRAAGVPSFPKLSTSLSKLQAGLDNLSQLVTVNNNLAVAQLNVKLASNDFTPAQTLQQARTALANAQRSVTSAQQSASQNLAGAYQTAQNATDLLSVAQNKEAAAQKAYDQDAARLKSGTIAATDLQNTQLLLRQAQFSRLQAQDNVLVALANLSVAAGQNLTGIGGF